MGLNRVEFVAILTWTLLLFGLVQGWIEITNPQDLKNILAGRFSIDNAELDVHTKVPTKFNDVDDYDEETKEEEEEEEEEEEDGEDFYDNGEDDEDLDFEFYEPETPATPKLGSDKEDPTGFHFSCTTNAFKIFMKLNLDEVKVIGSKDLLSVQEAAKSCGYSLNRKRGTLTVPFTGCFVKKEKTDYSLQLLLAEGSKVRTATCPSPTPVHSGPSPRSSLEERCPFFTPEPPTEDPPIDPLPQQVVVQLPAQSTTQLVRHCRFPSDERVACGSSWVNRLNCKSMGCCWSENTCFYPMDECTNDRHFVFSIHHDSASVLLDPNTLFIPGTNCKPVIVTGTVAVFKFKLTECGTRAFTVGGTHIYLAEVQNAVETLNLKYGVISRSNKWRFLIECRYSPTDGTALASTGYMVITPSSQGPSAVYSDGLYGVELKMAKDETYSSFYPTYHQPLRLLLGKKVYLQLHLLSPTPEAVILVNYCIAYPRSASNALVLVHEGCANPYDPHTHVMRNRDFGGAKNERRFEVRAFQFMEQNTNQYLDEEIYFMCSTEVCFPFEKTCTEQCFDAVAR